MSDRGERSASNTHQVLHKVRSSGRRREPDFPTALLTRLFALADRGELSEIERSAVRWAATELRYQRALRYFLRACDDLGQLQGPGPRAYRQRRELMHSLSVYLDELAAADAERAGAT